MSRKKQIFGLLLVLLIQFSTINCFTTLGITNYYLILNKSGNKCLSLKFPKSNLIYATCDANTTDQKFQFKLNNITGQNYSVNLRTVTANVIDDTSTGGNAVNWPLTTGTNSQIWTLTPISTDGNGLDWYTYKNVASGECLKFDTTNVDPNDNTIVIPKTTTCGTDDTFLFNHFRIKVIVSGVVKYSSTNAAIIASILAKTGNKVIFNKPDGTNYGEAAIDANSAYTLSVDTDTVYSIVPVVYDTFATNSKMTIQVDGASLDATNNADKTTIMVSPNQYTWKLKLSWTSVIKDLDIYIKSSQGCFFWNRVNSIITFINDLKGISSAVDEIDLQPTYTDDYVVFVKNYSKEGKLKDSGAKITIERTRVSGSSTVTFPATPNSISIPTTDHDKRFYQWRVIVINAPTQTYRVDNVVCADALDANCKA
jgi:hypothetical protein